MKNTNKRDLFFDILRSKGGIIEEKDRGLYTVKGLEFKILKGRLVFIVGGLTIHPNEYGMFAVEGKEEERVGGKIEEIKIAYLY